MEEPIDALRGVPLEVRQVRTALTREFAGLIKADDFPSLSPTQRERVFLTRALAAKAARLVSDCTAAEAAEAVTDGAGDQGIDAVVVSPETAEVWLIQAKWSDRGTARLGRAAVHKLIHGFHQFIDLQYDRFNASFQRLINRANAALSAPEPRIHLILATLGDDRLTREEYDLLDQEAASFNRTDELMDYQVLGIADFHAALRRDASAAPVSVTATLSHSWHMNATPYRTYLGTMATDDLASWYAQHGDRLFEHNVRYPLGLTNISMAVADSLQSNPNEFWYLNNGITVLCDSVRTTYFTRHVEGQPVHLDLNNVRIVNGAQTLAAIYHVYKHEPQAAAEALVSVRIICLDGAPADLAERIAQATNTQNHMDARDFAALDPQQELIRQDFAVSLGKSYALRRGEQVPAPSAGCSLTEAALALACAYPDAGLVARFRRDNNVLWHQGPTGVYARLFGSRPSALQIWRSVKLLRQIRSELATLSGRLESRDRGVADSADLLITHIAFQLIGSDDIDDPGDDWDIRLDANAKLPGAVLSALIDQLNIRYGQHTLLTRAFRDEQICQQLVSGVLRSLEHGAAYRELPIARSPSRGRRPNAVRLLVEHRLIEDGAQLAYRPSGARERLALHEWLSEAPERCLATWVNNDSRPLVWAVDERRYSPSGLVLRMWEEAQWVDRPLAVQGSRRWYLPGEGSLAELADTLSADCDAAGDGPGAE